MSDAIIRDPTTGLGATVSGEGTDTHLNVLSIAQEEIRHISSVDGLSFSWTNATYNYCAADTILAVRNTCSDRELHIEDIWMYGDTNTRVTVHTTDGASFTMAGTAVTGVNHNRRSGATAGACARADETGNTQGNIITQSVFLATTGMTFDLRGSVILGNGSTIGVDYVTDGGAAIVTITGFFD